MPNYEYCKLIHVGVAVKIQFGEKINFFAGTKKFSQLLTQGNPKQSLIHIAFLEYLPYVQKKK